MEVKENKEKYDLESITQSHFYSWFLLGEVRGSN